jgi:hypothetical protein
MTAGFALFLVQVPAAAAFARFSTAVTLVVIGGCSPTCQLLLPDRSDAQPGPKAAKVCVDPG